jgi:hypothetical protein
MQLNFFEEVLTSHVLFYVGIWVGSDVMDQQKSTRGAASYVGRRCPSAAVYYGHHVLIYSALVFYL